MYVEHTSFVQMYIKYVFILHCSENVRKRCTHFFVKHFFTTTNIIYFFAYGIRRARGADRKAQKNHPKRSSNLREKLYVTITQGSTVFKLDRIFDHESVCIFWVEFSKFFEKKQKRLTHLIR